MLNKLSIVRPNLTWMLASSNMALVDTSFRNFTVSK